MLQPKPLCWSDQLVLDLLASWHWNYQVSQLWQCCERGGSRDGGEKSGFMVAAIRIQLKAVKELPAGGVCGSGSSLFGKFLLVFPCDQLYM